MKANVITDGVIVAVVSLLTGVMPLANCSAAELVSAPNQSFAPPASGGGDSYVGYISDDGRYVVFNSSANNLAHRTNGSPYILTSPLKMNAFLRDRVQGTTTLISADQTDSRSGEDDSTITGISTNGQFVLFETASRLIDARTSSNRLNTTEVYLRDVVNKTTTLVSTRALPPFGSGSAQSMMTPDARYVAFQSSDSSVMGTNTGNFRDIYVRDMVSGQMRLASAGFTNKTSFYGPQISADGKFVAFTASLVSGNPTQDIYVCDLGASNVFCVSSNSHQYFAGVPWCYSQQISVDGKYVVYQANPLFNPTTSYLFRHDIQAGTDQLVTSNTIVAASGQAFGISPDGRYVAFVRTTSTGNAVFLWDGQTGTTNLVTTLLNYPSPPPLFCQSPTVDATGRYVSFLATGNYLVTNATGFGEHIYRRDMQSFDMQLVDVGLDGNATNRTLNTEFVMSPDGRYIVFDSSDEDLVAPDGNGASDVFVRDLTAGTTELISSADASLQSQTSGHRNRRSHIRVSADDHYAVFLANGLDLVSAETNRFPNVFLRDLATQSNVLVTVDTNGLAQANGASTDPVVSGDGRYVAFTSLADNLVRNDTNHVSDVFVRDMQTGTTVLASTNGTGPGSGDNISYSPSISLDGRYVTYFSASRNIVPLTGNAVANFFIYDRTLRTNYLVTSNGVSSAQMTPDGRYAAFYGAVVPSGSSNVYVWDQQLKQRIFTNTLPFGFSVSYLTISTNGQWLAYISTNSFSQALNVLDRLTRSNVTVSAGPFGPRSHPKFSGDGQSLVYSTGASNAPADFNRLQDVYVFNLANRSNVLASRSFVTGNAPTSGNSDLPDISADGRYVTFQSDAPDIVPGDTNHLRDIFLFDRVSGATMLLSASIQGTGTGDFASQAPAFTGDGNVASFQSWASDLAENDFNQGSDVFLLNIVNPIASTNPPPVFTGQLILASGSGGAGTGQSSPQLTWPAVPGFGYQVQYKTNLTDDTWLPVQGSVVIENGQGYIIDLAPDPDHRFYRIVGN